MLALVFYWLRFIYGLNLGFFMCYWVKKVMAFSVVL